MRRRALLKSLLAACPAALIPGRQPRAAQAFPVVATFTILADMAANIGGTAVDVTSLVQPDGDAHTFEPRPADLRRLQSAAAVVENGLGLEGWMNRLVAAAGFKGARIVASAGVKPRTMLEGRTRITDPHAWQDPRNGVLYARAIAAGLTKAMPARAQDISERAATYIARIEAVDRHIAETLGAIPAEQRKIITSHDAFGYFAARYGVEMHGVQGISTESEPSARDIARLVAQIRREHITAVFVENMTDPRLAAMLAREAGATLGPKVYSDALSPPDGPAATYLDMLSYNAAAFAAAMTAGA
jgi:zinc/manganese transport system substrate-binding protein